MLKKLAEWLGWLILAAVVAVAGFVLVARESGWEFDAVLSGSMEPALGVGGLVVIRPVDPMALGVGDIISFKLPGIATPICHRIIAVKDEDENRIFQTKGDANDAPDANLVPASAVKGKEVLYLPYVGNLAHLSELGRQRVNIFGKRLPLAVLVVLPLGLGFIALSLKDVMDELRYPAQKRRREIIKKRREAWARRR